MPLECGIIFDGIPEGAISRKVGLIWGIPVEKAGVAGVDEALVADQSSDQDDQDRRTVGAPCQKAGVSAC